MGRIKGWTKTREDNQYIVWQNDTTKLNLLVTKGSMPGVWKMSAMANMVYDSKAEARKAAVRFMRGRPNG